MGTILEVAMYHVHTNLAGCEERWTHMYLVWIRVTLGTVIVLCREVITY